MKSRLCKNPIFTFINIILFGAGAAGLCMIFFQFQNSIWHLCPQCTIFHYVCIGVASFVGLMGLLGLMATEMRSKCLLIFYKLGLFLLFLIAVGFVALVIFLKVGFLDRFLEIGWDQGVAHSGGSVCEFEDLFQCTGWNNLCPSPLLNATASCPMCSLGLLVHNATLSCSTKMHNTADDHFHVLLYSGIGVIVFIVVLNFIAYCAGRQFRYVDDPDDYIDHRQLQQRLVSEGDIPS